MKNLILNLKNSSILTLFVIGGFLASFFFWIIAKVIFAGASDVLMLYNPVFNGFLHAGLPHLIGNLVFIFVLLLFNVNQGYTIKSFYVVTFIISLLSLPFAIALGVPAIGISGTIFFLMSRACLNKRNWFLYIFFAVIFFSELSNFFNTSDGMAHFVHVIGGCLGFASLKTEKIPFIDKNLSEI